MGKIKVFLDSDVIIAALLSKNGASYQILKNSTINKVISQSIKTETDEVTKRLGLTPHKSSLLEVETIDLRLGKSRLVSAYLPYVFDQEDSHVVAAAHKAKVQFLLTYNLKHYRTEKIKNDFSVVTMKPGHFLQYLRRLQGT